MEDTMTTAAASEEQQSASAPPSPLNVLSTSTPQPTNGPIVPRHHHQSRQAAWWQSEVVRRSSSAVDEAVDELTEKSQFLRKSRRTPRTSTIGSSSRSASSYSQEQRWMIHRLDSPQKDPTENDSDDDNDNDTLPLIAPFHRDEIQVGELLGEGTFSCVYEVTGFDLQDDLDVDPEMELPRREIADAPPGRFALKHLKHSLLSNSKDFEEAATDLVMEAKYLSAFNHANILKLRGEPFDGTAAFTNRGHYHDGYFLLTNRLSETLASRIRRWKTDNTDFSLYQKTQYALQIAHALSYLHDQRILFRDLKPSNIGFHQESDEIQLFDFGLCRELPPRYKARPYWYRLSNNEDDDDEYLDESWNDVSEEDFTLPSSSEEQVFFMSGAGTQMYMAPEILLNNRYNLKADVYSWAMTFTEMLLLEKPLLHYEMDDHIQFICREGDRPSLDELGIPDSLKDLLAWAWEGDVSKRCTMQQVCNELRDILVELEELKADGNCPEATSSWPEKLKEAAARIQRFFASILGRAIRKMSSILSPRKRDSVTFDLPPQYREKKQEVTASEPPSSFETGHRDTDAALTKEQCPGDEATSPSCDPDLCSITPQVEQPLPQDPTKMTTPLRPHNRSALFKRKPSSASTTATTDDEMDDEYYDWSPAAAARPVVSYPSKMMPPPMEALVERRSTNGSAT